MNQLLSSRNQTPRKALGGSLRLSASLSSSQRPGQHERRRQGLAADKPEREKERERGRETERERERESSNEIFILAVTSGTVNLCCGDVQQNTKTLSVCLCGNSLRVYVRVRHGCHSKLPRQKSFIKLATANK